MRGRWMELCLLAVLGMCGVAMMAAAGARRENAADAKRTAPPYWAYAVNPPAGANGGDREAAAGARHVPGSTAAFTEVQIKDLFTAVDWHPDGHPAMPVSVAYGRRPQLYACGYCHLPNGLGRPENANLAGLPVEYLVQQMAAFKNGTRKSSVGEFMPASNMVKVGAVANDQEIAEAAAYFSALKQKQWIRVVESDSVPKTHVVGWMLAVIEPREMEPIGQRIIETPEDLARTELRDDASAFIAYVPTGSVAKGKRLASTGGEGKTVACAKCHGTSLQGLAGVPGIAGRSPSSIIRQLVDMQNGVRAGAASALMKPVVAKLELDDMIDLAAYAASLKP